MKAGQSFAGNSLKIRTVMNRILQKLVKYSESGCTRQCCSIAKVHLFNHVCHMVDLLQQ